MKKVSIYVENARLTPSAYYRLTQYFKPSEARIHSSLPDGVYRWWHKRGSLGRNVFSVPLYVFYVLGTLFFLLEDTITMRHGTVIVSRAIVPRHMPILHKYLLRRLARKNRLIWDFDDNILANKRISSADFSFLSRHCATIVVTGDYLKSLIDPQFADKVILLPTTDGDMLHYDPRATLLKRQQLYRHEVRLVWVATDSGLPYLYPLVPHLDTTAKAVEETTGKKLTLHVVCNKPLEATASYLQIDNIRWGRKVAKEEIISAHIGIMPLPDNAFTRGKGGLKLIQYMSTAMPVIASAVGYNSHVVTKETGFLVSVQAAGVPQCRDSEVCSWEEAILKLSADWDYYSELALNARKRYDEHFSYEKNKAFWMAVADNTTCTIPRNTLQP